MSEAFQVKSIYGAVSGRGLVSIEAPVAGALMLTPAAARSLAQDIIEAAEAAEQDGYVVEFAKAYGIPAAETLARFRAYRDAERERKSK